MTYDPRDLNLAIGNNPTNISGYLRFDDIISRVNAKLEQGVNSGEISPALSQWIMLNIEYFDPRTNINKSVEIRNSWNRNILRTSTGKNLPKLSELLEIFCGLAYVKAITSTSSAIQCSSQERNRVFDILGTRNPSVNNFRIWFPDQQNYPIIDSQVGYFEGNNLVAVFPISTKNISGVTPNPIKFSDIFENAKQPLEWKRGLPRKTSSKQGIQTIAAAQGLRSTQKTLYPLYAIKSILNSNIATTSEKNDIINTMRRDGLPRTIVMQDLKNLFNRIGANVTKGQLLDSVLRNNPRELETAKKIILVLLRNSRNYGNPLARISDDDLIQSTDETWNYRNLPYPFTVGNLSLFFEKSLSSNSVFGGGKTNYKKMFDTHYFGSNRALSKKYTNSLPLGAAQPIIAKVRINNTTGQIILKYDTTAKSKSKYGLRSKNSLNRMTDTLGIDPA